MKSKIILFLLVLPLVVISQIKLDTVTSYFVGPGCVYTKLVNLIEPFSIDILRVDLKNPLVKFEVIKGKDTLNGGQEKTSSISSRKNYNMHYVIGAINGDFFNYTPVAGVPTNTQVSDGEILKRENSEIALAFSDDKRISFQVPVFKGYLVTKNGFDTINSINEARLADKLILYNSLFGRSTQTNEFGNEAVIRPIGQWFVDDTVLCIVDTIVLNKGNSTIPAGKAILSGHGSSAAFISANLAKGDTIKIYQEVFKKFPRMKELIGGHPMIVEKDSASHPNPTDPFLTNRHPRTLVGINKDTSVMYLVTVDGRQASSKGMNVFEMYQLMAKNLKCYYAVNLDGGGSTTMVIRNSVMNSPSDGSERAVGNALLVVSKTSVGAISKIVAKPSYTKLFKDETVQITVTGWDINYNPVSINSGSIIYTCKPTLGTISTTGLFKAGTIADTGYIFVNYQGLKDSCQIIVKGVSRIEINPKYALTDKVHYINYNLNVFDTDGILHPVSAQSVNWKSTDTTIGKIDFVGQFIGLKPGSLKVIAGYMGFSDTGIVNVEIQTGITIQDSIETLDGFSVTGENIDSSRTGISLTPGISSIGNNSIKLEYAFVYDSAKVCYIYLNCYRQIKALPDSLSIDFRSDGQGHRVFFDVEDYQAKQTRLFNPSLQNKTNIFVPVKVSAFMSSTFNYPMKIRRIVLVPGNTKINGMTYSGTVYFDNLRLIYPQSTTGIFNSEVPDKNCELEQNFPNPFNGSTKILFSLRKNSKISLKVYDVLGNLVEILLDNELKAGNYKIDFNGTHISSGIYFYELKTEYSRIIKKLILLK